MAKQIINVGQAANDGSGDPLRNAFIKANDNFTELYDSIDVQDLDFQGDSGNGSIELDSQVLDIAGGTGLGTVASGQTLTINIDSSVVTLSGSQTLTNKTIDVDSNTVSNIEVDNLKSGVLDVDLTSVSASDDTIASAKAIKTYVDSQVTAQDLDFTGNSGTGGVDLDSQTLNLIGANGVVTTASGQTITIDTSSLDTRLTTAEANISSNDTDIATNATNIASNDTDIATNAANIATNVTDIATNATNISSNDTDITALQNDKYDKTGGTISGSVTISDDLTVNGTTTTVNTETLSVEDPLIEMANQNAANSVDTGFYAKYSLDAGVTTKYAGLFKDASDSDTFKLFRGLEVEPTTTINTGGTGYALADLDVAGLSASSGTISGNLIVDTDTLFVDAANNRVGIGTTSPSNTTHIYKNATIGDITSTTTANAGLRIQDSSANMYFDGNSIVLDNTGYLTTNGAYDFVLGTNNTPRIHIDSGGNVGIGVTPSTELHVKGSAEIFRIDDSSSTGSPFMTFFQNGTRRSLIQHLDSGDMLSLVSEYGGVRFMTGTGGTEVERMRITSSGNVGIGTTSPSRELDVVGVIQAQGNFKSLVSSSSTNLATANGGNVTLTNSSATDGNFNNIGGYNSNGLVTSQINFINVSQASRTGDISFHTHNGSNLSERMRIDSSGDATFTGNVGIGTDSPDTLLDVAKDGTGNDAPIIRITNKKNISDWSAVTDSMGKLEFYSDDSSGNAPYATGFVSVENDFTTGAPTLPSGALVFGTATYNASGGAVERMRIDSSGNVGIGTSNPSQGNLVISPTAQAADLDGLVLAYNPDGASNRVRAKLYIDSFNGVLDLKSGSDVLTTKITSAGDSYLNGGNVGIGTTSPTNNSKLTVLHDTTGATGATGGLVSIMDDKDMALGNGGGIRFGGIYQTGGTPNADMGFIKSYKENATSGNFSYALTFGTRASGGNATEQMRITSGGSVLFGGISSTPSASVFGGSMEKHTSVTGVFFKNSIDVTTTATHAQFINPNGTVGTIQTSGSSTAFNTSGSDLRLKKNIEDWNENVLDSFASIQPKEFHFNVQDDNEEKVKGYIAQDNVDKFPEAYPQDENGFYSYNPSGMVVYLMKAIQELKAEIETLKSQIQ